MSQFFKLTFQSISLKPTKKHQSRQNEIFVKLINQRLNSIDALGDGWRDIFQKTSKDINDTKAPKRQQED